MRLNRTGSCALLALTALIWGAAFVAQSVGMDYVEPFTFNAVRSVLGGAVLVPLVIYRRRSSGRAAAGGGRAMWVGGILCGVALCVASCLQQFGIAQTTVGKAGFITALYIVIVPLLGIFVGKRVRAAVWLSVLIAVAGMYLLCINESFSIGTGDALIMLCALAFSLHILIIDYFSPRADGVALSCIQFFTCGILSGAGMFLFESPSLDAIFSAWASILYAGVMSCGVAYTLQIVAQKNVNPVVASLILSLESVFSVLSGWVILGEALSPRELTGCALVFAAILLAQLPERKKASGDLRERASN